MLINRVCRMTVIASALLMLSAVPSGFSQEKPASGDSAKVKELLKDRLAVLRDAAEQTRRAHMSGTISVSEVHRTRKAVLDAELELCETNKERIVLLEQMVAAAKEHESQVSLLQKTGAVPGTVALRARVARLDAEIALERAKSKADPVPK